MNSAFPSGAADAEKLHRSKTIKNANALREQILNRGFNDSGTGINLKINFPLYKSGGKTTNNL
jgi:hypothetical protein